MASNFFTIPEKQMAGAIVVEAFAIISTLALLSVAIRILWLRFRTLGATESQEYVFFNTQLGYYAACLLVANFFTGISGLIGLSWVLSKGIREGSVCTGQALIMQIGNWAQAYFTVAIALHTFNSLVLKRRQSIMISATAISLGWIMSCVLAAVPALVKRSEGNLYGASGFSCGIRAVYPSAQFLFHLLPIFIASILSAVLYSIIFLVLRGTLKITGGLKLTLNPSERWNSTDGINYHQFIARVAKSMLWYPIGYIALLVPYSVMRLLEISGYFVLFEAMVLAFVCWFMLGIVNVLFLYNTFRVLVPAFDARSTAARKDGESFSTTEQLGSYQPYGQKHSEFQEQVNQYRLPWPVYGPQNDDISSLGSGTSSVRHLINHERNESGFSSYSFSSKPAVGQPIIPISDFDQDVATPINSKPKVSSPTGNMVNNYLQLEYQTSLPAPPRRTRSPTHALPKIRDRISPISTSNSSFGNLGKPNPRIFVRNSRSMETFDNWGRAARYRQDISRDSTGRPVASAVSASLPGRPSRSPRQGSQLSGHSRSLSAVKDELVGLGRNSQLNERYRPSFPAEATITRTSTFGYTNASRSAGGYI